MRKRILALGLDPAVVDFSQTPDLTPQLVAAFIEQQLERLRAAGYDVVSCLVDLGATAEAVTAEALGASRFDCVLIGAGLRAAPHLLLFEKLLNLVHERAPHAKICFTTPADSTEAVRAGSSARARGRRSLPELGAARAARTSNGRPASACAAIRTS
jgi:hypothetical protein